MKTIVTGFTLLLTLFCAQQVRGQTRHEIHFPDIPGYQVLKCDLHMHTVFSDGLVWPTVRVEEAWRLGLDAISLTDHLEYQPHRDDVPTKHNRPYELALERARETNVLLIRGAEITRDTPPGHFNAVFLKDADPLDTPNFVEAIKQANDEGAFVFWNHHEWKGPERGRWMEVHTQLHNNKWFQGMEVCNGATYYPTAHKWCLEKGLTMIGNSDIHDPDLKVKNETSDHRTLTLVFAKERTPQALKEALLAGRTAVWFEDKLIGREEVMQPMFHACVHVAPPHFRSGNSATMVVQNKCDLDIHLQRTGRLGPKELILPARTTSLLKVGGVKPNEPIDLQYTVANFWIGPQTGLPVTLECESGREKGSQS